MSDMPSNSPPTPPPPPSSPDPAPASDPKPPRIPHGTLHDPKRVHPVLDIAHWEAEFPLGDNRAQGGWIDGPGDLARVEQARRLSRLHGELGACLPADFFIWSMDQDSEKPWLTQLGGTPWREQNKPWPKDSDGIPMHFLGQICFADSKDILPCKLPGEVALIFGRWQDGWAFSGDQGELEWSSLNLADPMSSQKAWTTALPFCYQGVIHRSVQYTDHDHADPAFTAAGFKKGASDLGSIQATSIGRYANLPQGWPFSDDDECMLIASLSSFYFGGNWPLCNVPRSLMKVRRDGSEYEMVSTNGLDFGVGDAGCIWIYRDKDGIFKLDEACG